MEECLRYRQQLNEVYEEIHKTQEKISTDENMRTLNTEKLDELMEKRGELIKNINACQSDWHID